MSALTRQIEREKQSVVNGVARYQEALEKDQRRGRYFDGPAGQKIMLAAMTKFVPVVEDLCNELQKQLLREIQYSGGKGRAPDWALELMSVSPIAQAYITLRTLLTAHRNATSRTVLAKYIGRMINLEARWLVLRQQEAVRDKVETSPPYNRLMYLKRQVKQINPRAVRSWLKKMEDIPTTDWGHQRHMAVGLPLLLALTSSCPEIAVRRQYQTRRFKATVTVETITASETVYARLAKEHNDFAENTPWLTPMVCPPQDWKMAPDGTYQGGYWRLGLHTLLKSARDRHTSGILEECPIPEVVVQAVNRIQKTPWRINARVLDVLQQAWDTEVLQVLPVAPPLPLPPQVPEDQWSRMSKAEKGTVTHERARVYDHNFKLESRRALLKRQITAAKELRNEPEIYFPHNLDFRGRVYPLPQDLHPQTDDAGKGLLIFAHGKPLGPDGLEWMTYHTANCYGLDKETRDQQAAWVVEHLDDISLVATDPLGAGIAFWAGASDKWQFLAAAIELDEATKLEQPAEYVCALPVHVDGSCNGLQHLSAMGLDPAGAHATNLTSDPVRQDIYQIVADKVVKKIEERSTWEGRVSRDVVKRGVMTVPYGLTDIGMRDQLIDDGWCDGLDGDMHKNATYLRDLMKNAISDTVKSATEIMKWMQTNAGVLAKAGKPIRWMTPTGMLVQQAYTNPNERVIYTIMGVGRSRRRFETSTWVEGPTLKVVKQMSGIVPNIIHSFDAAHMLLTITDAPEHMCFSAIHDSYGVHACDMSEFLDVIKLTFVFIYSQDWFTQLQADFVASCHGEALPLISPPASGDFDIEEVLDAQFFFA